MCCNPSWCKTTGKCLHQQPGQQTPAHVAEVLALSSGNVSRRTDVAVRAMDDAIVAAINAAKDAGVPQGLITQPSGREPPPRFEQEGGEG